MDTILASRRLSLEMLGPSGVPRAIALKLPALKNLDQVIVNPPSSQAFGFHSVFERGVFFKEIQGNVSDGCEVLRSITFSNTAIVFAEIDSDSPAVCLTLATRHNGLCYCALRAGFPILTVPYLPVGDHWRNPSMVPPYAGYFSKSTAIAGNARTERYSRINGQNSIIRLKLVAWRLPQDISRQRSL